MLREEINIRDPFILNDGGVYYLYGSTDPHIWGGACSSFSVYRSRDLERFEGPFEVFRRPEDFWSEEQFWAPEVHRYGDRYYLFAAFRGKAGRRSQILVSDSPMGPFAPFCEPFSPEGWDCLDATLFVEDGDPYTAFCREWVQIKDGTIELAPLKKDLSGLAAAPITLFSASQAPWVRATSYIGRFDGYITDGPFFHRLKSGKLLLLWSSCAENAVYAVGMAVSDSGSVRGPYRHIAEPLFAGDGGHACIFRGNTGELFLALHAPNSLGDERPCFFPIVEEDDRVRIKPWEEK